MTDGELLYREICRDPRSIDRRLVYADWLDDHGGHELAAYIRDQIHTGRTQEGYLDKFTPPQPWPFGLEIDGRRTIRTANGLPDTVALALNELGTVSGDRFTPSPWAEAVARGTPVTRFFISDQEPWEGLNFAEWGWWDVPPDPFFTGSLDPWLFNPMWYAYPNAHPRYRNSFGFRSLRFRTRDEALDALALTAGWLVRSRVYLTLTAGGTLGMESAARGSPQPDPVPGVPHSPRAGSSPVPGM